MIPFWPKIGIGMTELINHTILMSDRDHPFTKTSKEDIEKCIEALRQRDRMMEIKNVI